MVFVQHFLLINTMSCRRLKDIYYSRAYMTALSFSLACFHCKNFRPVGHLETSLSKPFRVEKWNKATLIMREPTENSRLKYLVLFRNGCFTKIPRIPLYSCQNVSRYINVLFVHFSWHHNNLITEYDMIINITDLKIRRLRRKYYLFLDSDF